VKPLNSGRVVLDSWAILQYLEQIEPACGEVAALLRAQVPIVSWINLGEVFYILRRRVGELQAQTTVRDLRQAMLAELPTEAIVFSASRIKADHPMAYADAFAAATALAHSAELWTGDPELLIAEAQWNWRDLRGTSTTPDR